MNVNEPEKTDNSNSFVNIQKYHVDVVRQSELDIQMIKSKIIDLEAEIISLRTEISDNYNAISKSIVVMGVQWCIILLIMAIAFLIKGGVA